MGAKADAVYGGYEDALFAQHVVRSVEQHDTSRPYFLYWAPHIVHTPLQVWRRPWPWPWPCCERKQGRGVLTDRHCDRMADLEELL